MSYQPETKLPDPSPVSGIADPAPLGLAGFALTTMVLSLSNANIWPAAPAAIGLAVAYGGLGQLLAGMWEFKRNNTFGALAFSSYGAFWISFFVISMFPTQIGLSSSNAPEAIGAYLFTWAVFTAYMTVASLRVSGAVVVVFVLLTTTFVLLSIGAFQSSTAVTKAGGWVGIATAAAAWYASFAGVTNATFKKTVIPVWPLSR